uniref:Osteocrin n=1 Tax=Pseudonaja textilis TaxID=8673 RepID=A0A670ZC24_PSETE
MGDYFRVGFPQVGAARRIPNYEYPLRSLHALGVLLAMGFVTWNPHSTFVSCHSSPLTPPEKSTTDLVAEMLLLNKLASLENDVFETKTKRSFAGFGGRLDRLSKGLRTKQRGLDKDLRG